MIVPFLEVFGRFRETPREKCMMKFIFSKFTIEVY